MNSGANTEVGMLKVDRLCVVRTVVRKKINNILFSRERQSMYHRVKSYSGSWPKN